jgi:hypothetical protein
MIAKWTVVELNDCVRKQARLVAASATISVESKNEGNEASRDGPDCGIDDLTIVRIHQVF